MILKLLLNTQVIWTIFIKNVEEYNANKKRKLLIVFNDMIADMVSNKKLNTITTELFIRGRKLNISLIFITQSYFDKKIFNTLFHYENYKQTSASTNRFNLIIQHILTFKTL